VIWSVICPGPAFSRSCIFSRPVLNCCNKHTIKTTLIFAVLNFYIFYSVECSARVSGFWGSGGFAPRVTGALPLDPRPLFCLSPLANSWLRPCIFCLSIRRLIWKNCKQMNFISLNSSAFCNYSFPVDRLPFTITARATVNSRSTAANSPHKVKTSR